ncbi:MAG TPA: trigger factor [Acidimicrobiales bacterium]|nr:trigger factor [Acidimicrobiales bacterium]
MAPLEGNKVKLSVEVEESEVEQAIDDTFVKFAKELRVPGFRPGKAPRRVLEARIGRPAARQEALDQHIPFWYDRAVRDKAVDVINDPEIEVTAGKDEGALSFDAVVEVRPQLKLVGYEALKVTIPSPVVTEDELQAQVDRLRGNFAELAPVEREARNGDSVVIDMTATRDGKPVPGMSYTDYSVELGAGNDLPELDEHLPGAKAGDTVSFQADLGDSSVQVEVVVNQVQEKILPEATDEWASEASEFSTVAELRADIEKRLTDMKRVQSTLSLRNGTMDALVALVDEEPPVVLVDTEVRRSAEELGRRLDSQGIPLPRYLEAIGRTIEEVIAQLREQAIPAVKGDLALRSVADAVGIEPSESEMEDFMERLAGRAGVAPAVFREQVERAGRRLAVRSDLKKSKAFDWLVEHAEVTDEEGNPVDRALLQADTQGEDEDLAAQSALAGAGVSAGEPGGASDAGPAADPAGSAG